jgi:hypothetical protein
VVSRRRFLAGEFSCRAGAGTPWSAVSAVRWEGGLPNVPFQAVILVMSPAAAETLMEGQLLLGPPNRVSEGRGVIPPDSDVVVFTIPEVPQMGNGRIRPDPESNRELYGKPTQHELLLQGRVVPSTASAGVLEVLNRFSRPPAGT